MTSAILGFALCGFAIAAVPGQAADMGVPARSYYPPPPPPAIYDWTDIYVGGHIGGGMLVDSVSQNGVSTGGFDLASTGNLRPAGVIGGAQIGANYEFAPWVIGVEASWTDSAIDGNTLIGCVVGCSIPPAATPIASERFTSNAQWFATVTGRAGYAANDWLFYAKAGGAWMRVNYTEDLITQGGATAATQVVSDSMRWQSVRVLTMFGPASETAGGFHSARSCKRAAAFADIQNERPVQ